MGYWDIPDGSDCVQKAWFTTKLATGLGLLGSAYHMVAYQPETALEAVKRVGGNTVTMATMGAIFGLTTCLVAQARDTPDEPVNYFVGGCASGIFLGARTHNPIIGSSACVLLGTLGFFTKVGKMENWTLVGPPKL